MTLWDLIGCTGIALVLGCLALGLCRLAGRPLAAVPRLVRGRFR